MRIRRKKTFIEQAADYVEAAMATAREKAGPLLSDARDKAGPALADARDKAGPVLADARDSAGAALADARDKAGPVLADARDKAGPILADARDKAAPLLAQSAAIAADRASAGASLAAEKASEARDLATVKVNELRGQPPKKHRLRKLVLFTGVAALLGFVATKLKGRQQHDEWQSSYTPTPASSPTSTRSDTPIFDAAQAASDDEPVGQDEGGASPDEALADSVEEEHPVTTPDDPAEVVDLAPGEAPEEKPASKP